MHPSHNKVRVGLILQMHAGLLDPIAGKTWPKAAAMGHRRLEAAKAEEP